MQTVTLTGTYRLPNGDPASGVVEIIPSEKQIVDADGNVILSGRVKAKLVEREWPKVDDEGLPVLDGDGNPVMERGGSFSETLPATDDLTLNPTGFGYTVVAKLHHTHLPAVSFSLPAALVTVDVADIVSVDPTQFDPVNGYTTSEVFEAHESATTGVHGIADTAALVVTTDPRLSDARPPTSHNHDDRYYTEAESDALLASKANASSLTAHTANTANPHAVTKAQVGLGNVDNTADTAKPVSTAQAAADAAVQSAAIQRANHTGTQAISTVTGLQSALDGKAAASSLATVATTGSYGDLVGKPTTFKPDVTDPDLVAAFEPRAATFNVRNYGAAGDGTTDDRAAIQSAVDAAVASITATGKGAVLYLPPGTYYLNSSSPTVPQSSWDGAKLGVKLPVNLNGRLIIAGAGDDATTIKLSTNARNAFWINQTANYQTFRNVTFRDLAVDNNGSPGVCHVLIGSVPEFDSVQPNLNFADLRFSRLRTYGYTLDTTQTTQKKMFIGLVGNHLPGDGMGTQTSTRRVLCEDIRMDDVQQGLIVESYQNQATNHWYDDIRFHRCSHTISTFPQQILQQTSFFICGSGFGDYCEIIDCYSENVGDDGIELGAMQRVLVERFRVKNPFLLGVYFRQLQNAPDPDHQVITLRDCSYVGTSTLNTGVGSNPVSRPLSFKVDTAGVTFGTFNFENLTVTYDGVQSSKLSRGTEKELGLLLVAPARRMVLARPRINLRNMVFNEAFSQDYKVIMASLTPTSLASPNWQYSPGQLVVRDAEIEVVGGSNTTANSTNFHILWPTGQGQVDVDGLNLQFSGFTFTGGGGGTLYLASLGRGGELGNVRLRRIRGIRQSAAMSAHGISLSSTGTWQGLDIDGCDFRSWTSGSGYDVHFLAPPTGVGALLAIGGANKWAATGANSNGGYVATASNLTITAVTRAVGVVTSGGARTVTLPAVATVPTGAANAIVVKDESGNAATNNVTIAAASGEFIEGAASRAITTAYGSLRVYSTGTKWVTA